MYVEEGVGPCMMQWGGDMGMWGVGRTVRWGAECITQQLVQGGHPARDAPPTTKSATSHSWSPH